MPREILRIIHKYTLIIILIGINPDFLEAQSKLISFERITIDNGLSQNSIEKITQDGDGFIWIATQDGLNRYDGYNFKIFNSNSNNSNSLSSSMVSEFALSADKQHIWLGTIQGVDIINTRNYTIEHLNNYQGAAYHLPENTISYIFNESENSKWIGTIDGLHLLDVNLKSLTKFQNNKQDSSSISNNNIRTIFKDQEGNTWVGTANGLNKIQINQNGSISFERFPNHLLSNNAITVIWQDDSQRLWVGTENGLNIIDIDSHSVVQLNNTPDDLNSLSDERITAILKDSRNTIWIGTKNGLNKLVSQNNNTFHFKVFRNEDTNPFSLSNNWISSLFEDKSGVLWIGTYFGGISKLRLHGKQFNNYKNYSDNHNSLSSNIIRSITKDSENQILWVGANPGLNKIELKTGEITRYFANNNIEGYLNNNIIRSLEIGKTGKIWIGTGRGGINIFDPLTNTYSYITHDSTNTHGFKGRDIRCVFQDSKGYIWAGTNNHGLNKINPITNDIINYRPINADPWSIGSNYIFHIKEDKATNLWICTYDGLDYYVRATGKFHHYRAIDMDSTSIPDNYIKCVLITKNQQVWIGSAGGGITKLIDREKGVFKTYSIDHGLVNNFVYGILEDDSGNLWISTNRGISQFNPNTEKFTNFEKIDGLQGNEFNSGAFYKSAEGEMFFGGIDGLTSFFPDSIKLNLNKPNVIITDIQIFNQSIFDPKNSQFTDILSFIKSDSILDLTYKENVISFEFSALEYSSPLKNKYAYKMEGFDENWTFVNADKRFATYTNLPHGDYKFMVMGSNNDKVWSDKIYKLDIQIAPPFYKETWFIILASLIGFSIAYGLHYVRLRRLKQTKKELTIEVKRQTSEIQSNNELLKERQAEVLAQNEQLERQTRKLENSYENVRILSDIGQEITSILNLTEILDKVYSRVNILLDTSEFGIGLYDEENNAVVYMLYDINGKKKENIKFSLDTERFSCWVIKNKKSIWLGDVKNHYHEHVNDLKEYKKNELLKSLIGIPMIIGEKTLGIVSIQSQEENAYSKYHYDMLSTLTSYITVAIDNANSYNLLEQKVNERTADVKKAYAELIETNSNFDQFTYRSAHDLRGPLARILGLCQLGLIETKDHKGQEYLTHLEKVAFEMDHMLSRLLRTHHNKSRELITSTVFIRETVDQALQNILKKQDLNGLNISMDILKDMTFETDPFLFLILIENLLDNAFQFQDYSKKENALKIKAEKVNNDQLRIVVWDNGVGILNDFHEKIFDMFFIGSDMTKGSGLGLYEAMTIVKKFNGCLKLLHSDKEYTEFEILL